MSKLTRREAALVAHAKRRAILDFKRNFSVTVRFAGRTIRQGNLFLIQQQNRLSGRYESVGIEIDLTEPWGISTQEFYK